MLSVSNTSFISPVKLKSASMPLLSSKAGRSYEGRREGSLVGLPDGSVAGESQFCEFITCRLSYSVLVPVLGGNRGAPNYFALFRGLVQYAEEI